MTATAIAIWGAAVTNAGKTDLVVVGVDGSPASAKAMTWAAHYAQVSGATVKAVMAWHYPAAAGQAPVGVAPASVTAEVEQGERAVLDQTVTQAAADHPGVAIEAELAYGHPSEVLLDQSRAADLLVIGSRGRGGFKGMLLGSVSHQCVTHAACPVTVVRLTA